MIKQLKVTATEHEPRTLRDEFAMAALQGLLARPRNSSAPNIEAWADNAYKIADCMLARRLK